MTIYLIVFGVIFLICLIICIWRLCCRQNDDSEDDIVGISTALQMPMNFSSKQTGSNRSKANDLEWTQSTQDIVN